MPVVAITGSHPRHVYLVERLRQAGLLKGWIVDKREDFVPAPPDGLSDGLRRLFIHHFEARQKSESAFFGEAGPDTVQGVDKLEVSRDQLNSPEAQDFLKRLEPELVISYGCGLLRDQMLSCAKGRFWNVHGGLSPWYRGAITHFWPSYLLEPQMTGMTLHITTPEVDGGAIIHQNRADLVRGDGLHDLTARAVLGFADELPVVLQQALSGSGLPAGHEQKTSGRIWTKKMWRPDHLRLIYETYGDRIVDAVLDGDIEFHEPKLVTIRNDG